MSVDRGLDCGGRGGYGAAFRRRGRRLRMHWRHEQLSIRMVVESTSPQCSWTASSGR